MNEKSSGSRSRKQRLTAVGTRCADHVTPFYPQKSALTSPTGGGRSVGIVRVRTKATEFSLVHVCGACVCVCHIYSQSFSASISPVSLKFLRTVRAELPILRPECGSVPYQ